MANGDTGTIAALGVSSSGISALSGSPYALGVSPTALAITPGNSFLYVASAGGGAIYGYSIGTNGVLSLLNNGSAVATGIGPVALKVDTTGKWLIAVDLTPTAYIYGINSSTGLLAQPGQLPITAGGVPSHIAIAPNDSQMYISLSTTGVGIFTFNSTSGVLTDTGQLLKPVQNLDSDTGLAIDPTGSYLFVSETGISSLRSLSIATTGALTEVKGSPFATGTGPSGVLVDSTGSFVYVTNLSSNSITGFSLTATSGALTPLSGSPFATGTNPLDIAEDSTHTYIGVVSTGGNPDLEVYTMSATVPGALTSFKSATTDTDPAGALAIVAAN